MKNSLSNTEKSQNDSQDISQLCELDVINKKKLLYVLNPNSLRTLLFDEKNSGLIKILGYKELPFSKSGHLAEAIAENKMKDVPESDEKALHMKVISRNWAAYISRIINDNRISSKEFDTIVDAFVYKDPAFKKSDIIDLMKKSCSLFVELNKNKTEFEKSVFNNTDGIIKRFEKLTNAAFFGGNLNHILDENLINHKISLIENYNSDSHYSNNVLLYYVNKSSTAINYYEKIIKEFLKKNGKENLIHFINNLYKKAVRFYLVSPIYTVFPACIVDFHSKNPLLFMITGEGHGDNLIDNMRLLGNQDTYSWEEDFFDPILHSETLSLFDYDKSQEFKHNIKYEISFEDVYKQVSQLFLDDNIREIFEKEVKLK